MLKASIDPDRSAPLSRRLFAGGAGVLATSALFPGSGAAAPGLAGEVAWSDQDGRAVGYRAAPAASAASAAPLVVVMHGLAGLDAATRELCRSLASSGHYAIAPDLFARHRKAGSVAQASLLHRIDDGELARNLGAAAAFAEQEGADRARCTFLGVSACGRNFVKSADARFSRVETRAEPTWARLVAWLRAPVRTHA